MAENGSVPLQELESGIEQFVRFDRKLVLQHAMEVLGAPPPEFSVLPCGDFCVKVSIKLHLSNLESIRGEHINYSVVEGETSSNPSYFRISSIRSYQKEVIETILHGRDCLVVRATGAGKSLCFQLPPTVSKKTAIVVSPLLSLMQDQVMSLNQKGIHADYLGCTQSNKSVSKNAENGLYDVLFLTPEKAMSLPKRFWDNISSKGVCLFAVDEAHCISEWGHDFRQHYKSLHVLREKLPGVPFVALTATATDRVREDIIQSLKLKDPLVSIGSFDRPNIFYSVNLIKGPSRVASFVDIIKLDVQKRFIARESTIIYCLTIRETQEVYEALSALGVSCAMYHGQMDRFLREKAHKDFLTDNVCVMVATIAFGMGIDKPNVRCVIHLGCPKSLESYYQESGRCGRDGLPSSALLYYNMTDFLRGEFYCSDVHSEKQKESIMASFLASQKYCMISSCRRRDLLLYFGEESSASCGNCDNCTNTQTVQEDLFREAVLLLTTIKQCGARWGLNMPINVLRGSKARKIIECDYQMLSVHGEGKSRSSQWWKYLASILLSKGFIAHTSAGGFRNVSVTPKGEKLILDSGGNHNPLFLNVPKDMIGEDRQVIDKEESTYQLEDSVSEIPLLQNNDDSSHAAHHSPHGIVLNSNDEFQPYEMLLKVRSMLAEETSVTPYDICTDEVLRGIARTRPSSNGSLSLLSGVNQSFLDSFGVIFLHHVKEFCEDNNISVDNFDSDATGPLKHDSVTVTAEDSMTCEEIIEKILNLVSSSTGVSIDEILSSFQNTLEQPVLACIEDLRTSFAIYFRNGLIFKL